jgi:hypothetical protein
MPAIPATVHSTSLRLDFSATPSQNDPTVPQGTIGPALNLPFALDIRSTDTVFLRTLLPGNSQFNFGGSAVNDGFKFGTFPNFSNRSGYAPISLLDGNGVAISFATIRALAIIVQPILPWASGPATGLLTNNSTNLTDGLTVTVGTVTYTFKNTLSGTAGQVKIAASAAATLVNLVRAINYTGTPGTDYVGTVQNPDVSAATGTATTVILTARIPGTGGNTLALTTTAGLLLVAATNEPYPQPAATLTNGRAIALPQTARPFDGSVCVTLSDEFLPDGAAATSDANWEITKPFTAIFASPEPWTPGTAAKLDVQFKTTLPSPYTHQDVNAQVTVLLVGTR